MRDDGGTRLFLFFVSWGFSNTVGSFDCVPPDVSSLGWAQLLPYLLVLFWFYRKFSPQFLNASTASSCLCSFKEREAATFSCSLALGRLHAVLSVSHFVTCSFNCLCYIHSLWKPRIASPYLPGMYQRTDNEDDTTQEHWPFLSNTESSVSRFCCFFFFFNLS